MLVRLKWSSLPILWAIQKKTHEEYYRLPQDVFQTAKVSKILIAINKGKGGHYKGKSLDEINLRSDDSDSESRNNSKVGTQLKADKFKGENVEAYDSLRSLKKPKTVTGKQTAKKNESTEENDSDSSTILRKKFSKKIESDSNSYSSNEDVRTPRPASKKKKTTQRQSWSTEQSRIVRQFFDKHIKEKIAPKKHEVEELKGKYPTLFKNRNWVIIKAYVYNCYRQK